jgi:hypothetical protein
MQVILNEQGYVHDYAIIGGFGSHSITAIEPENLDDFERNYGSYHLSEDGMLVKNEDKQKEIEVETELADLRSKREKACFTYINRGDFWYSRLTYEQKEELDTWYQAWLDVTETKVIPEKPEWLA